MIHLLPDSFTTYVDVGSIDPSSVDPSIITEEINIRNKSYSPTSDNPDPVVYCYCMHNMYNTVRGGSSALQQLYHTFLTGNQDKVEAVMVVVTT